MNYKKLLVKFLWEWFRNGEYHLGWKYIKGYDKALEKKMGLLVKLGEIRRVEQGNLVSWERAE